MLLQLWLTIVKGLAFEERYPSVPMVLWIETFLSVILSGSRASDSIPRALAKSEFIKELIIY